MEKAQLSAIIVSTIHEVLAGKSNRLPDLRTDTPLDASLGLDSIDWAVVVVRLEEKLGYDPFAKGSYTSLRTLGDFIEVYEVGQKNP